MKRWQIRLAAFVLFALGMGASMAYLNWLSLFSYIGAMLCCIYLIATDPNWGGPWRPGW